MTTVLRLHRLGDPVVDVIGVPIASAYAETYWLPILGPSAMWLLRHAARHTEDGTYEVDVDTLAGSLGLVQVSLMHTLDRLVRFGAAVRDADGAYRLRTHFAPLTHRQVARLPEPLRQAHGQLVSA